jgi:hypothetical protein
VATGCECRDGLTPAPLTERPYGYRPDWRTTRTDHAHRFAA